MKDHKMDEVSQQKIPSSSALSDYEAARARNIERNNARLRSLGFMSDVEETLLSDKAWRRGQFVEEEEAATSLNYADVFNSEQLKENENNICNLKPLFEVGEQVYAAWWDDDDQRSGESEWFLGRIHSYKTIHDSGKYYGPTRMYHVKFDDGDEIDDLEDCFVFSKEDYELMGRENVGVRNVVDKESDDDWASIIGWYAATIGGQECPFSRLSDAMRAYDKHVISTLGERISKSCLNVPENYPDLWKKSTSEGGEISDKNECKTKVEFEAYRDYIISQVPESIRKRFRHGGFSKWGKDWLPVIELGPFDVEPGPVRDLWMYMFHDTQKSGRGMTHLVFWYGVKFEDRGQGFSFVPDGKIISYKEGERRGFNKIPLKILTKIDKNKTLTKAEEQIKTGLEQIISDMALDKNDRIKWMMNFKEDYELAAEAAEQQPAKVVVEKVAIPKERKKRTPSGLLPPTGRSLYRGVHWQCNRKKWMARYTLAHTGGKNVNLGAFANEKHAALAFDTEARRQGRPDSDLNFPNEKATETEIISWKGNRYKTMTKNGKRGTSVYRGVCKTKDDKYYHAQCNINIVKDHVGIPKDGHRPVHLGFYLTEVEAACVYDQVCRESGVPEHELNFPLDEGFNNIATATAVQTAKLVIENIRLSKPVQFRRRRICKTGYNSSRYWPEVEVESDNDEKESDLPPEEDDEDDDLLCEVEAFIAKISSSDSIEVKWVGSYDKTIKTRHELREELDLSAFDRYENILDRWSTFSIKSYDEDSCLSITHDDHCMVCNDGGELICCDTCPCVAHPSCIRLKRTCQRWRCAICRRQAPDMKFIDTTAESSKQSGSDTAIELEEEDDEEDNMSGNDKDTDSVFDQDDYLSSSDEDLTSVEKDKMSVERRYRRLRRLSRRGHCGAKPVEKLAPDGTVLGVYSSKREAVLSLGLTSASNLSLKDMNSCTEFRGFFWRLKGSNALPSLLPTRRFLKSCKPVEQICLRTGDMIERYNSVAEASRAVGIAAPSISNICNGWKGHISAGGFGWRFSLIAGQVSKPTPQNRSSKRYQPVDNNRQAVEQVDPKTGDLIATFKSKADVYCEMGSTSSGNCLSTKDFQSRGTFAFGFFWRPADTDIVPSLKSPPRNRKTRRMSTPREKAKKGDIVLYGEEVVGQSAEIYNRKRRLWESGTVESFNKRKTTHTVTFASGYERQYDLSKEKLRWGRWKQTQFGKEDDECPICFIEPLYCPAATVCGHLFCKECISSSIEVKPVCPICNMMLEGNRGKLTLKSTSDVPDVFRAVERVCMKTGNVIQVYSSAAAAAALLDSGNKDLRPYKIINICSGEKGCPKSAGGFAWRFHGSGKRTQLVGERAIDGKEVECRDIKTGEVLNTYKSIRSAAELTGLSRAIISSICKKTRRDPECGGFFWCFKGDDDARPWAQKRNPSGKPVEQVCLETGKCIAQFDSATEAIKQLVKDGAVAAEKWEMYKKSGFGITSDIGLVCRLERQSSYGYFWRYQGSTNMPWDYQAGTGSNKVVRRISTVTEKVLQEYPSAVDAHRDFFNEGVDYSRLCRACREGGEFGGYFWEYVE